MQIHYPSITLKSAERSRNAAPDVSLFTNASFVFSLRRMLCLVVLSLKAVRLIGQLQSGHRVGQCPRFALIATVTAQVKRCTYCLRESITNYLARNARSFAAPNIITVKAQTRSRSSGRC